MTEDLKRELTLAAEALAAASPTNADERTTLERMSRQLEFILDVLCKRGALSEEEVGALRRLVPTGTRVQLTMVADKRSIVGVEVDCASLLPLCKARCCSFKVSLAEEDVRDGRLRWKLDEPYVLEREADGYCTHLEPAGAAAATRRHPRSAAATTVARTRGSGSTTRRGSLRRCPRGCRWRWPEPEAIRTGARRVATTDQASSCSRLSIARSALSSAPPAPRARWPEPPARRFATRSPMSRNVGSFLRTPS